MLVTTVNIEATEFVQFSLALNALKANYFLTICYKKERLLTDYVNLLLKFSFFVTHGTRRCKNTGGRKHLTFCFGLYNAVCGGRQSTWEYHVTGFSE